MSRLPARLRETHKLRDWRNPRRPGNKCARPSPGSVRQPASARHPIRRRCERCRDARRIVPVRFRIVQRLWRKVAALKPAYSFQHALNCRLRNLAPIEAGLAGLTHRKIMGSPNCSRIHLFGGLQGGYRMPRLPYNARASLV
jgi:hypothetical protein